MKKWPNLLLPLLTTNFILTSHADSPASTAYVDQKFGELQTQIDELKNQSSLNLLPDKHLETHQNNPCNTAITISTKASKVQY